MENKHYEYLILILIAGTNYWYRRLKVSKSIRNSKNFIRGIKEVPDIIAGTRENNIISRSFWSTNAKT